MANRKEFVITANDGTHQTKGIVLGLGEQGKFNYTIKRRSGSGTVHVNTYECLEKNPVDLTSENAIAIGAEKQLGDTDNLTLGLASDVDLRSPFVVFHFEPTTTGASSWVVNALAI